MISFIVPAYNEELELSSTLAAIRAATSGVSQPFEIIVVDDASTDATPEIAEQAGARVVSINRRQIAAARNAGARAARVNICSSLMPIRGSTGRTLPKRWLLSERVTPAAARAE